MVSGCSTKEFKLGWYDKCLPSTVEKIKKVYPVIDEQSLQCGDIPKPDVNMTKQSEVSTYLLELTIAGKSCHSNLNYVKMLLYEFKKD